MDLPTAADNSSSPMGAGQTKGSKNEARLQFPARTSGQEGHVVPKLYRLSVLHRQLVPRKTVTAVQPPRGLMESSTL